jgi:phage/plasmid-associated DNA primase
MTDDAGQVYAYKGGCWNEVSDVALRRLALIKDGPRNTSAKRRGEILSFLKDWTHRKIQWGRVKDWEVATANCVVDVRTKEPRDHRPSDYLERVIPHPYTPHAPAPA